MSSSLGSSAFVGELTADVINYTTLNPAVSGAVNNPMTTDLDGGGNDITNVGALTAGTLNYTALNPPINPGITNPLAPATPLDANNNNITNVNEISATTGTFNNSTIGASSATSLSTNSLNVGAGGGNLLGNYTLGGDITDSGSSTITCAIMNMTQSFAALTGAFTNNITIGGSIASVGDIKSTSGTFNSAFKQVKPFIWDVGTTSSKPSTDSGYILFTTTTGTQLSTTLTLTLPNATPDREGLIVEFSGTGMLPDIGAPTIFNLTCSYNGTNTAGGALQPETLPIGFNSLTYGRIRVARNSQGRIKWVADP